DRVAIGHLGDGHALVHGGLQIGVIGADAGSDDELELLRLVEALLGHIGRPEGLGDDDLGIGQLLLEHRVRAFLVRGHYEAVACLLQKLAQAELPGYAAQKLAWLEIDGTRRRGGLTVRIVCDLGNVVAGIFGRVAVDWIGIENEKNFRHFFTPWLLRMTAGRSASRNSRPRTLHAWSLQTEGPGAKR